jgi:hypothetical protein
MEDMRDLRFMAQIFSRQGAHEKLFEVWDKPPPALQGLMQGFSDDVYLMKMDILKKNEAWGALHEYCVAVFEKTIEDANKSESDGILDQLLMKSWSLFGSMLEVKKQLNGSGETTEKRYGTQTRSVERFS